MDLKEKVNDALRRSLDPDHIQLEDEDGISGFVVSARFRGVSALDRQMLIHQALHGPTVRFSRPELRQVLAIAALTPAEFAAAIPRS